MAECTTLESLLEMGFDRNRAEKAVAHTGNQGIERAMDWLMEHENDPDIDEPYVPPEGNVLGSGDSQQIQAEPPTDPTADVPGDGSQMTEGGELKRPLTEEEKQEQIKRLEELMRVKQEERRERERQEEVEREKQRRKQGQELQQIKQKLQEEEMKKLAEQRRREKMEDRIAKQKVREKIARDREERAQKFGGGSSGTPCSAAVSEANPSSSCNQGPPPAKKDYDECRIQVRLLDGSTLTTVFKAQEPLAAVRVYVQMNGAEGQDFTLLSPYPRRVYTDLDMEKPLRELGLVPSAVLVVAKK
ncbi:UBX domain-containing protein 1 [Scleropages formosus]|uniref:UBX domain protein 1 n=1 Tax=Scleropages formosus TaxID=113540 RepID=A0A8C9RAH4_SCLFO|nr:UBX domain-containing protein 1 [Scleropages formosus]XP_018592690.1 UBX domain-containing protein 1 [Scleropages formosus]